MPLLPKKLIYLQQLFVVTLAAITFSVLSGVLWPLRTACILLLFYVVYMRHWKMFPAALLIFLLFLGRLFYPDFLWSIPTIGFLLPVVITFTICFFFRPARPWLGWIRAGEQDTVSMLLVAATCLLASAALFLWAMWTNNLGAGAGMVRELRNIPIWFLLLIGVPAFAMVNAFVEEVVYRGFIQSALEAEFPGKDSLVLGLQASAFAAAHFHSGFPNGYMGYTMTFIYASMLGYLKLRTSGMLASFVTHVAADMVIGITLVMLAT